MTAPDMATLLEGAADRIADVTRADLQVMLRRAALLLRNSGSIAFDADIDDALRDLSGEFGLTRSDTIRFIVREWMEKNTYLPVYSLGEDDDVQGSA
ncbi:CopG family transcriptional regulator [Rhizobium anhuiense]|uniref:CopG family transcriptional regulator n=1 Tax=Rhizobium anhuiense TaxID=1184720 RepID=UPI000BE7E7F0|nr:CopG family transcriptional regulator [Rhizobium anhuiense]PDS61390.1 CopG family transcriptional regulator [Rhizobium anhuiense]